MPDEKVPREVKTTDYVELVSSLDDGALYAHLQEDLGEVIATCRRRVAEAGGTAKATLSLRLTFAFDGKLMVIKPDVSTVLPRPKNGTGMYWVNRRLTSLGLTRHDDEETRNVALAIVERFRQWTDRQKCLITGKRTGEHYEHDGQRYRVVVHWCHVLRTRGAWAADFGTTVPMIDLLHARQEREPDFFSRRGMDPAVEARQSAVRFFREHPRDADWMMQHANDGTVIQLASEGRAAA